MIANSIRYMLAGTLVFASATATADPMSKEACVDAHSKGQDARDAGKLSLARKLFMTCAQSACPNLVQGDCARFADELNAQQPTIAFVARDKAGADLPDTTVYVDDALVVTRLDDGRPHDADPGKHVVRFSNGGRDEVVTIVLNNGEKGRTVLATFPVIGGAQPAAGSVAVAPLRLPTAHVSHPFGAKLALGIGSGALVGGIAVVIVGLSRVPSNCSISTHECVGAPGDPSFAKASSAARLTDYGWAAGAVGAALVVGGFVWYITGKSSSMEREGEVSAVPWLSPTGGGLALSGRL